MLVSKYHLLLIYLFYKNLLPSANSDDNKDCCSYIIFVLFSLKIDIFYLFKEASNFNSAMRITFHDLQFMYFPVLIIIK